MYKKRAKVSIIIVNYKVEKELIACISSIVESKPKVSYEIIVVDNDEKNNLKQVLKKQFPTVKYIKSPRNLGYGAGNNLGVKFSKGKYIFFLNPDTNVVHDSVDALCKFINNNPQAGMVAPLLLDMSGKPYPKQGSDEYTFINAIIVLSFINKVFPNNAISAKFFHKNWNRKEPEEFDVVPGTAFMIKRSVFNKIGMFDEKFFLYFEEYDLAKRLKEMGLKNYIIPNARVAHVWEASTKKEENINKIFSASRFLFFKKHYGIVFASVIHLISNFGKYEFILCLIIGLTLFLSLFKIKETMVFIGDQGWFYLSARDFLTKGEIPLVGISSSRPWLHQGPLWTYLLTLVLWIFNFNPIAGAYITIVFGALSVFGLYVIGSMLFSKRVGLIASLLYATSPLAVYYMRLPYHTSIIPFFVIPFIFALYKIFQNKVIYIFLSVFLISILYNLEIATIVLVGPFAFILGQKILKKEINISEIINKKILTLSLMAISIPLFPIILYDIENGFPQTLKFTLWIFYRILSFFGYNPEHTFSVKKIITMINFLFSNFTKLIFPSSDLISFAIVLGLIIWIIYLIFKKRKMNNSYNLLFLLFFLPLLLIILNQTPSDAYLPILFPTLVLLFSLFLDRLMLIKKMFAVVVFFIIIMIFENIYFMLKNDFNFGESNVLALERRIQVSNRILDIVQNKDYNLIGKGNGSEFESFTMNYEYLTWWLGHPPSKKNENLKLYISESEKGIKIEKND